MICRHGPNDTNCSGHPTYIDPYRDNSTQFSYNEPDSKNYIIERCETIGNNIILIVKYPDCSKCSYEGRKILVYLNLNIVNIVFWKEIDPHFKDPKKKIDKCQAPAPNARFPANEQGWNDALEYARYKCKGK